MQFASHSRPLPVYNSLQLTWRAWRKNILASGYWLLVFHTHLTLWSAVTANVPGGESSVKNDHGPSIQG
jgi:hypothetical protein